MWKHARCQRKRNIKRRLFAAALYDQRTASLLAIAAVQLCKIVHAFCVFGTRRLGHAQCNPNAALFSAPAIHTPLSHRAIRRMISLVSAVDHRRSATAANKRCWWTTAIARSAAAINVINSEMFVMLPSSADRIMHPIILSVRLRSPVHSCGRLVLRKQSRNHIIIKL